MPALSIPDDLQTICKQAKLVPQERFEVAGQQLLRCRPVRGKGACLVLIQDGRIRLRIPEGKPTSLVLPHPTPLWQGRFLFWAACDRKWKIVKTDLVEGTSVPVGLTVEEMDSLAFDGKQEHLAVLHSDEDPDFPQVTIFDLQTGTVIQPNCSELIGARISALRWPEEPAFWCHNDLVDAPVRIPWDRVAGALGWEPQPPSPEVVRSLSDQVLRSET